MGIITAFAVVSSEVYGVLLLDLIHAIFFVINFCFHREKICKKNGETSILNFVERGMELVWSTDFTETLSIDLFSLATFFPGNQMEHLIFLVIQ